MLFVLIFKSRHLKSTFSFKPVSQLDLCIGDFDLQDLRGEVLYCLTVLFEALTMSAVAVCKSF